MPIWVRFLVLVLPLAMVGGAVLGLVFLQYQQAKLEITKEREKALVWLARENVGNHLKVHLNELVIQASQQELREFLSTGDEKDRRDLVREYIIFAEQTKSFDQVRVLDLRGRELLRINYADGRAWSVPRQQLQDKSSRYYFKESIKLRQGQIYISPFDLNKEHGRIEIPLKPMIRLATPVFDKQGRKRGVFILNFLGQKLLDVLKAVSRHEGGHLMLLNSRGYWLFGTRAQDLWGFMYPERKDRTFGKLYPRVWQRIRFSSSGQIRTGQGLFTYGTIHPRHLLHHQGDTESHDKCGCVWKIVSLVSRDTFAQQAKRRLSKLALLYLALVSILCLGAWLLVRAGERRRQAEEALRASEERYRSLFNSADDAICLHSSDASSMPLRFLDVNDETCRRLGYSREELLAMNPLDLMVPEDIPKLARILPRLQEQGHLLFETRHRTKDGRIIPVEVSTHQFKRGELNLHLSIARDISERKEREAVLRRAMEAAEQASRAKSRFLATMSHEIRTPMNGIIGMTDLVLESELSSQQREYLEIAKKSAQNLLALLSDILDFARMESGEMELETTLFSLRDTLKRALKRVEAQAREKGLELELRVEEDVPDFLQGDAQRLEQVLGNFLGNAVKFTVRGKVELEAKLDRREGDQVVLHFTVRDTGIGIPPDKQEMIFQPFTQADATVTRAHGGAGLGLAIAAWLVKLMGGRCWARSQPGRGSDFHFTARFQLPPDHEAAA